MVARIILCFLTLAAVGKPALAQSAVDANGKSELIAEAIPTVVRVDTPLGHGTGFFVSADGWIVTNQHVIANAPTDPITGYQFCRLSLANVNENAQVELLGRQVWGTVFKVCKRSDLALIRADELPAGLARSPYLQLSQKQGLLGEDCFTIGMPARGVNWTIRQGVVSGHGVYPRDFEMGQAKLSTGGPDSRSNLEATADGSYQVTLSTCGVNPGDSGGPVFNTRGEVIAVNKAIPLVENQVNMDKFTYHIHRDELADFLKELPMVPEITPPALKPQFSSFSQLIDEQVRLKAVQMVNPRDQLVVIMMDIDAKGPSLETESLRKVLQLPEQDLWKKMSIDWAFIKSQRGPTSYFFDLNQDGSFEQVFVAPVDDGASASHYTYSEGKWLFSSAADDFLDRIMFESSDAQSAYTRSRQGLAPKIRR